MNINKKENRKQFGIKVKAHMRSSVSSRFKDDIIIHENKDYKEVNMTDALRKIAGSKLIKKKEK